MVNSLHLLQVIFVLCQYLHEVVRMGEQNRHLVVKVDSLRENNLLKHRSNLLTLYEVQSVFDTLNFSLLFLNSDPLEHFVPDWVFLLP